MTKLAKLAAAVSAAGGTTFTLARAPQGTAAAAIRIRTLVLAASPFRM
jgi:hypothetical protein